MIRTFKKEGVYSEALFSECEKYRYKLTRVWDRKRGKVMFIGLNPSTADETEDDQTIRRCKRFASDWGYGGLCMANLFAIRATDPKVMLAHPEPVGPENAGYLHSLALDAGMVVAAWGNHGAHRGRDRAVRRLIEPVRRMYCLGKTNSGQPKHPSRLRADTPRIIF